VYPGTREGSIAGAAVEVEADRRNVPSEEKIPRSRSRQLQSLYKLIRVQRPMIWNANDLRDDSRQMSSNSKGTRLSRFSGKTIFGAP
jgi:hypothetical protein